MATRNDEKRLECDRNKDSESQFFDVRPRTAKGALMSGSSYLLNLQQSTGLTVSMT